MAGASPRMAMPRRFWTHAAHTLLITLACVCKTSDCQTTVIFGIARSLGDSNVHRVNITSRGDYAEILKVIDNGNAHRTERSDPTVGISTWNPVEKYFYYASAEDGFASAYVSPYDTALNASLVQRAMRGTTGTSFTLTSLQFNSRDSLLYGMITYSSGEHFFIRMYVNTTARNPNTDTEVDFVPLIQLDYTHIVPGLSALRMISTADGGIEYLHGVGLRGSRAFLFAVRCRNPPRLEWDQELDGVLTSIEADIISGDLYGMLHNASGHYLLRFDVDGHVEPGAARDDSPESTQGADPEEEGDSEIVLGLSSYAPSTSKGIVPTYHRFKYSSTLSTNGTRIDTVEFTTQNVQYTDFEGDVSGYARTDQALVSDEGYTLASIEMGYPRIPSLDRADPSVAHITGGMLVTVKGSPFVDTGPKILCRWRPVAGGDPIYSVQTSFVDSGNIICETPQVFARTRTRLDISLTEGLIWTVNTVEFTFFEILSRLPIEGSSKGDTLIQFSGIFFEDLPIRISELGEQLDEAQCEFGLPVEEGGVENTFRVIDSLPQAPQLKKSSCREVAIGVSFQLVCSFACVSPVVPHRPCNPNTFDVVQGCLRYSLLCPNEALEASFTCQQLIPNYEFYNFRLRFFGQVITFPEGWQYIGDESPILEFARFSPDFTSLILKLDILSDKARMIGGTAPSSDFIMSADDYLGANSFAAWVLPNRLRLFFGPGVQFQDDTILAIRPYTIASFFNIYRYVSGIFTPVPLEIEDKINPEAQMIVPQNVAQCTEKTVRAGYSKFAGARALEFLWGMRVGKCIDKHCLNSIQLRETAQPWVAVAQQFLTTQAASPTVDTEEALCGQANTLDIVGGNRVLWVLQTRNFLYDARALDLSRDECFSVGEQVDETCLLCTQDDPDVCPGVSSVAAQPMRIYLSAPPAGTMKAPAYLEVSHGDVKMMAAVAVPNGQDDVFFIHTCERGLEYPEIEDLAVIQDSLKMQWTVSELVLPDAYRLETVQRLALSHHLMRTTLVSNTMDLAGFDVYSTTSAVTLPKHMLRPGHFYRVSFEIAGTDTSDDRVTQTSSVIFVKRRDIKPKVSVIVSNKDAFETYEGTDNVFFTAELCKIQVGNQIPCPVQELETINITAAFTEGLDTLGQFSEFRYRWACRMWPGVYNSYRYWDDWIEEEPVLGAEPCIFNNTEMFPKLDQRDLVTTNEKLVDKQMYEFKLEITVTGLDTTLPDGVEVFRAVQRVTIMRRDSLDFWSTVKMELRPADGVNPRKARPGEPLILNYQMEQASFLKAFAAFSGRCRAEVPCSYLIEEIGNMVDMKNQQVTGSITSLIFEAPPGELSIIMKPLVVVSGVRFVFRVTMFQAEKPRAIAELQIDVNSIPRAGRFEVSPMEGAAFADKFSMAALGWEDDEEDLPLAYAFSYELQEEDAAYIDGYHPRASVSTRLPMRTTTTESFPCSDDVSQRCSMVKLRVYIRDVWEAEAVSEVDVPIYITDASTVWDTTHGTFLEGMSDGMLGKDFGAMLKSFTMTSVALEEPVNRELVNGKAQDNPSALYDAQGYQDAMLNAIINFAEFDGGQLFEFTPILASQLSGAIDSVIKVTGSITDQQRTDLMGLMQRSADSLATVRVPLSILSQIISSAANLIRGNLEKAYELRGSRRLLQNADPVDLAHEVNIVFLENVTVPVCRAALQTAVADSLRPEATTIDNNELFYVSFARVGSSDNDRDTVVQLPKTDQCDEIEFTVAEWSNAATRNFCFTVFKYNPVEYTAQSTTDGLNKGELQAENNVPWPLHPRSCSVQYRAVDPLTGEIMLRPGQVRITLQLPPEAARTVFPELPQDYNGLVFRDVMFSASCQEWTEDPNVLPRDGTWSLINTTTLILNSDPSAVCNGSHWPELSLIEPPPLASGGVVCQFPPEDAIPGKRSLFGVLTEKTDCLGVVDTAQSMPEGVEWNDGQFAIVSGTESDRKVCDRCKECGGVNDCELFCDNKLDSGSTVDVCGVCGGFCTEPDCTEGDCDKPYLRYLGNKYPNDWDVGTDGFTDGLFFYDGPCEGPTPVVSPNGICTDVPVGDQIYRTEQYPYNSDWKICWENSPVVPVTSPDARCVFQARSLRIDEPGPILPNRTLSIWVLDQNGQLGLQDGLALHPTDAKENGTNPLPDLHDPSAVLEQQLDLLEVAPERHWNSHYPPQRVRAVMFSLGSDGRIDTRIELTLRPVNDPPKIVAPADPYVVQEDRPTLLTTPNPIRVDDDGDDVEGTAISLSIEVVRVGALIRIGTDDEFTSKIELEDTVANVNAGLRNLFYLSPENSNDEFEKALLGAGQIVLKVTDNGSGGEFPYNESFSHTLAVNMTTVIANDPPIPIMPRSVSIFQNGTASILGGHIVDVDMWQHERRRYESELVVNQGEISIGLFRSNCTMAFNQPVSFGSPTRLNFVDERTPFIDGIYGRGQESRHLFMKLDGRVGAHKVIYLLFKLTEVKTEELVAGASSLVVSLFKHDCYDSASDLGRAANEGSSFETECVHEGDVFVSVVSCSGLKEDQAFLWADHLGVEVLADNVGVGGFSASRLEWVDAALDTRRTVPHISSNGELCLQISPGADVQETQRYYGIPVITADAVRRNALEEDLAPKLDVLMGFAGNFSKTNANCSVNVTKGTGNDDTAFTMQASTSATNALLENITFSIISRFSNMLGGTAAKLTLSVRDLEGYEDCLRAESFGNQGCSVIQNSSTEILIIPYKEERIDVHMQPWYSNRWVRVKSINGEVPLIVAFEDCGNRGWFEDCPDRMQFIPAFQEGEYQYGVFSVEFSSRLGTFTVPEEVRPFLTFEKGDGFRDGVVRFRGFAPDVRRAMLDMIYHTKLDDSLQYKNVYSSEHLEGSIPCSRTCFFNDIGPPTFNQEDEAIGCSSGCSSKIYDRGNNFTAVENGIFLDDIVMTFSDNGVTGIGLTGYTTILMYNVYTVAENDNPCIIFKGRISEGCREKCAHIGLPFNCFDSGLPFDLTNTFNTTMFEGQEDAILLGGMVAKNVDELESTRLECRTELGDTLARRGDGVIDPVWLDECPKLNVIISAKFGWTSLNSREFIQIYLGAEQSFWSPIAFLGYTIDVNSAMRMLRYRMSDGNPFFNSNQGTEVVTIQVLDQGFSGADPTGEFDGTNAESLLSFTIHIVPVNNIPFITVPRPSDPITVPENVVTQLSSSAEDPGLNITDVDSDECDGVLEMTLQVKYGRLFVLAVGEPGFTALASSSQDRMDFYSDPRCQEEECSVFLNSGTCSTLNRCQWLENEKRCLCKRTRPGSMCNNLKMRGLQGDVQAAMQAILYVPRPNTNTYSYPEQEAMVINASDKVDPANPEDTEFSCGVTLGDLIVFAEDEANILVNPVNQPPTSTNDPSLENFGFEFPEVCEGFQDCTDELMQPDFSVDCVGVASNPPDLGWTTFGRVGVSFTGWVGDVPSAEGRQHLYMAPSADQSASISQMVSGLVVGAYYKSSAMIGARSTTNGGAAFSLTLGSPTAGVVVNLPSISIPAVNYILGKDSTYYESDIFIARQEEYLLEIRSFITAEMKPPNGRLNFVDDVQIQFINYNMLEGESLRFKAFRVLDADSIPGVQEVLLRNGAVFDALVTLTCKYGVFSLELDVCSVLPHETGEDQVEKIAEWGVRCGIDFYKDRTISEWANSSAAFRTNCPSGWVGTGTADDPCVNLPLTVLNTSWGVYDPSLWPDRDSGGYPSGQTHIPTRVIQLAGTLENLETVVRNNVNYVPDLFFNTQNLGKEEITVVTNDRGNFNGPAIETTQVFPIFVQAVNNPPNITFSEVAVPILEDVPIKVTGVQFEDPDVDEISCFSEPCESGNGILALKVTASNGSLIHDDRIVMSDIDEMVSTAYEPITSVGTIILCMWKLSCVPQGGYLTLRSDDMTTFCAAKPERCDEVLTYCAVASMGLSDINIDLCRQTISSEFLVEIDSPEVAVLEQNFQSRLFAHIEQSSMVSLIRRRFTLFLGTMGHLRSVFDNDLITYIPDPYFNGIQPLEFFINDLANEGIGCPPNANFRNEIDEGLHWDYCAKTYPIYPLTQVRSWDITVIAVNNPPALYMYNDLGTERLDGFEPMSALTNVTRFLNVLEVIDPDFEEGGSECVMDVEVGTRSGGRMFFNKTKAPFLDYLPNIYGTLIAVRGSLTDVNTFMRNIEYTSDVQFNGIESIVFDIHDNGCTGQPAVDALKFETFILEVSVARPKTCQFETCEECIGQILEVCGWCPASCEGRGKCRDAVSIGGPPLYGGCDTLCNEDGCVGWNMCKPDPDRSWIIGAVGSPLLLIALVGLYTLFMWARREHGTIPLWGNKAFRHFMRTLNNMSFSPKEGAKYGQLAFLAGAYVCAGLLPGVITSLFAPITQTYSLGEALTFTLVTDHCAVKFVGDASLNRSDPALVVLQVSPIENVFVTTDFCLDDQFIRINNSRLETVRYDGYLCEIEFSIPKDPGHTLPAMTIINEGPKATTIRSSSADQFVNFGPNAFGFNGTVINVLLHNLLCRRIAVPNLEAGFIDLRNGTFTAVEIHTTSADVFISTSEDLSMLVPYFVEYVQPENNVCFMSKNDAGVGYEQENKCAEDCTNRSYWEIVREEFDGNLIETNQTGWEIVCVWRCEQASTARLIPYKRDLQPGLSDVLVDLRTETGQLFFSGIPDQRVPPLSGRTLLDNVYVYDGLLDTLPATRLRENLKQRTREYRIDPVAQALLDEAFHPGGASRPKADWYELVLTGPATPPGQFIWVSDVRYLVLDRLLLQVLSLGLLTPSQGLSTLTMDSSPCPHTDLGTMASQEYEHAPVSYDPPTSGRRSLLQDDEVDAVGNTEYLKRYYRLLFDAVNGLEIPPTSMIVYKPLGGDPFIGFGSDSKTGSVTVKQVVIDDYPLMNTLLILGLFIPAVVALMVTGIVVIKGRTAIKNFRNRKFDKEHTARQLLDLRTHKQLTMAQRDTRHKELEELRHDLYARTNFFYFLDYQIGDPDKAQSLQKQIKFAFAHLCVVGIAILPLLVFAINWENGRKAFECPTAPDVKACEAAWSTPPIVIYVLIAIHGVISFAELYCFYSLLPWARWRKILRLTWYGSQAVMMFASLTYILVVVTWIFIGLIVTPSQYLPYCVGFALSLGVLSRFVTKTLAHQKRLRNAISERVKAYTAKDFGRIPGVVVENIVERQIARLLRKRHLSGTAVTRGTFVLFLVLFIVQTFLFIGFHALTDVNDLALGVFKGIVTAVAILAVDAVVNHKRDFIIKKQDMALIVYEIVTEAKKGVEYVKHQVTVGEKLVAHMRLKLKHIEEQEAQKKLASEVEVGGLGFNPEDWYRMPAAAAKTMIHDDRYAPGGTQRIAVEVAEVEPQVDISAMPAKYEPESHAYHPDYFRDSGRPEPEEPAGGTLGGPTVVMTLEGDDEGMADPYQLAYVLAQLLGVSEDRFSIQVADM